MGAIMMERLVKEYPDLIDNIDLVAGCSNGAILGLKAVLKKEISLFLLSASAFSNGVGCGF